MTWIEQWRSVAARIDGLMRAVELYLEILKVRRDTDSYNIVQNSIVPELTAIATEIRNLNTYDDNLPSSAASAIERYGRLPLPGPDLAFGAEANLHLVVALAAFRSEFEYLIRDVELEQRNRTELAFEHLRRLIAVDAEVREKWKAAFCQHETACEQLGAVHLLTHGIWAFKIAGVGAATDLVYPDNPLDSESVIVKRTAWALVLTEWKRVTKPAQLRSKAAEARRETDAYRSGILGGTELKTVRYMILVTKKDEKAPDDVAENGITYRHICVPVEPSVPSLQARRARSTSPS